jgi:hypothetical protein
MSIADPRTPHRARAGIRATIHRRRPGSVPHTIPVSNPGLNPPCRHFHDRGLEHRLYRHR